MGSKCCGVTAVEEVAGISSNDFSYEGYREELEARLGLTRSIMRRVINQAKRDKKRIVFCEGEDPTIIKAEHLNVSLKVFASQYCLEI